MTKMIIGGYTMDRNPSAVSDLMTPHRHTASVQTYSSVAFFSWGATMVGKSIVLEWDYCPKLQYDTMQALYTNDVPVAFTPQDGTGKSYTVEITDLVGTYFLFLSRSDWWRQKVRMTLLILSEGA